MLEGKIQKIERDAECSIAPEICIEVLSFSNTSSELEEKQMPYFSVGAIEFWVCDENGNMTFFDANGPLTASILIPEFPYKVKIIT